MMSSRLEPMSTTLMIDHRVYIHSPITGVMCGLHARCGSCDSAVYSFLEPGPTRGPATAGLTAGAMKPLSGHVAACRRATVMGSGVRAERDQPEGQPPTTRGWVAQSVSH